MNLNRRIAAACLAILISGTAFGQETVPSLKAKIGDSGNEILVFRGDQDQPIVTQVAKPDFRPYLHPIEAPDGKGQLTQFSPGHHKHQTGIYWGLTRVNGRDFFHHPEGDYWRRTDLQLITSEAATDSDVVQWQTTYEMLAKDGSTLMVETQLWSMSATQDQYKLSLTWKGDAKTDIDVSRYDYGGLFIRMPWKPGFNGEAINSARQKNRRAEGQRAVWLDIGMQVEGREDLAHIAIFDHPNNKGFPQPWRVDGQLGVGPARARLGDWHIHKGETETIRHQLVMFTGRLNDLELTKQWSDFSEQEMPWSQWGQAQQEGRQAKFLTPEMAVKNMTVVDGIDVNMFASEPMITQPMAFCWDSKGRMWIAENRDYESRGSGFANSGDSRILILEDTDRDGVADKKTVFAEGIPFPAGIAVGMDGLWLGAPPNLLFVPDRDGDDKADLEDIEVRLTGWGIRDRHETLNSFHWGPDGWLYGCQGFATPSRVGVPKGKGRLFKHKDEFPRDFEYESEPVDINGGIWRYHPTKRRFEVVAHGFSNPWGIDYNAKGQLFITACVIPHLWHVIPGGIYHRQGGSHFNRHYYEDIKTIATHRHRSAHGGARVYLSDAMPPEYHDRLFMANIHEHAVLTDVLEPSGSGYVGAHGDDFALANNAQWIGFSLEIGPDGSVYVLDWHDADICGKEVLNKETGRVFRFTSQTVHPEDFENRYADLNELDNIQLARLQTSKSAWHARRARLILQHRATSQKIDGRTIVYLRDLAAASENGEKDPDIRLRALWALHQIGGSTWASLKPYFDDHDEHMRAWSIQLLLEDKSVSDVALKKLVEMASNDTSPVVRLYLAAALQRLEEDSRWPIIEHLVNHAEDKDDHNLPKMIWFGLEPVVVGNPDRAFAVAAKSSIPKISRFIARRLTSDDQFEAVANAISNSGENRLNLLLGLRDGLEGRFNVSPPKNWQSVYRRLQAAGGQQARIALHVSQQFGDSVATETMMLVLKDDTANIEDRKQVLKGLVGRKQSELVNELPRLLENEGLRREAIRAYAAFDDDSLSDRLLAWYPKLNADEKLDVIHSLSSRSKSGWKLTMAIKNGVVPKKDVPAYVARILRRVVGSGFVEVWGPVDELSDDKQGQMDKYRSLLSEESLAKADARKGRAIFNKTCATCHKLYGYGAEIGPDITGANRTDLEYLISNISTPSAVIQDDYKMTMVLMDDGRLFSGVVAGEDERILRLRVANEPEPVNLAKSEIESRKLSKTSMMPDGILNQFNDQEVVDLIGYLRSLKQVELPK